MFKNYLKTAWRNLMKNKTFSAIIVMGLAIGIAAFLMIANYLRFEYSFDDFHAKKDRIFRLPMIVTEKGGEPQTFAFTYPAVAPAIKKDFPEVSEVVRFRKRWGIVQHGDEKINESGFIYFADPSVFRIFSFEFQKGAPAQALTHLNDAVISQSTATKYFGNSEALGKTLRFDNEDYVVTGVVKDFPANSHLQFHILLNFNKYIQLTNGNANTSWGWSDFYTYVLLKEGTDANALEAKLPAFAEKYMGGRMKEDGFSVTFKVQPLKDIHTRSVYNYELEGSGNLYYLKYLGIAALLILLISLINHVNLSTAHSLERSREVGVRKVMGATKLQLVRQFLAESFLVNLLGMGIGFLLYSLVLPKFAQLISRNIADLEATGAWFWVAAVTVFMVSTLLAGFYPAFVLSSFQPVKTLKSAAGFSGNNKGSNYLRKALVVLQFTAAIILTGGAIGFYQQLRFMSSRDLGVNIRQTLVLEQTVNQPTGAMSTVESFVNDLGKIPGVRTVSESTDVPGNEVGSSTGFRRINSNDNKSCRTFGIDEKFIPDYGITMVAGRNFDKDQPFNEADSLQVLNVIINETASRILGFGSPDEAIGKMLMQAERTCKVVGVMFDYHQQSLQYSFDPIIYYPARHTDMGMYSLKVETADVPGLVARTKDVWNKRFPGSPFQYFFLDDHFDRQYKNDQVFSSVLWWFTVLSIVIAGLGLFGLSLYSVAKRTREIGVRKVLGATVTQIFLLITRDYLKLVLYAGLVAIPVAAWLLTSWMEDYAFHIDISPGILLYPLVLILLIAVVTVAYQSVKAALANPVNSLRTE
ncbi:ABC transporter permease [Flavihumibacter solisilvae]|uniref:ABC transporter permease n=1 Tax=Flavihumibacter solisilvae TaxID=1349421 RepID=A0A0C1KZ96_9BACT|nr:ABC transporter permease [Flavihumibacter solisilvae]KIC93002.1 hypothetical protein OI18_19825 [Flavihumibacter solisilvae]